MKRLRIKSKTFTKKGVT